MKKVLCTVVILIAIALAGCQHAPAGHVKASPKTKAVENPRSYGQDVYYFDAMKHPFGSSLAEFLAEHQSLEVTAMAGDGTGLHGMDKGYYVTFHLKAGKTN